MARWHLPCAFARAAHTARNCARIVRVLPAVALPALGLAALPLPVAAEAYSTPGQTGGTPVLQRIQQSGVIRIAYRESSVPFSYLAHGRPVGYAIDLCQ